ncbi:hypothetical protein JR316_0007410 [Psilocybe cubensis]|uniref:Uncharacterized protein n=2 Tax=Psilocybe cubensis TaxID=181762 RepID=A0ACB8GZA2_PSICU|nr:hypothetical protein JR316_0007410 [Psilocybe cubensis]KAH9480810.1 hypothetical protein JR316_0007410 [Psilocybe cubensis]
MSNALPLPSGPHPTHVHHTPYADPVVRPPSPASSVGTTYPADQTSFSDSEAQISQPAFERKHMMEIELHLPRKEEMRADKDPLVDLNALLPMSMGGGAVGGRPVRLGERKLDPSEERVLVDKILSSLRSEIAKLEEDSQFEEILRRGSKAALEEQPSTNNVDLLMRSMMAMGPSFGLTTGISDSSLGLGQTQAQRVAPVMTDGPWNNFGGTLATPAPDSFLSGTTAGKRSRNGTSRKL